VKDDTTLLRALASPVRQSILERLGNGAMTGAQIARELGSNTGVTSYHLRELEAVGLVERDETRGRSQYWRLAEGDLRFNDPGSSSDPRTAQALVDRRLGNLTAAVARYLSRDDLGDDWRDAALFSQSALHLTVEQLAAFQADYLALLARWALPEREGATPVRVNLFAFPEGRTR
jgi:DNA-binding transcriptional ArsR family regulator